MFEYDDGPPDKTWSLSGQRSGPTPRTPAELE